jgi:hypothetical protein
VAAANAAIISSVRYIGLTVGIINSGHVDEYWYYAGITDGDLVLKSSGGGESGISGLYGISGIAASCESYTVAMSDCDHDVTISYIDCTNNTIELTIHPSTSTTFCAQPNTIKTDMVGDCLGKLTITDNGPCATGCDYDYMLIASHSTSYVLNDTSVDTYYCGNHICGWDSCDLDITYQFDRNTGQTYPLQQEFGNCGIPLPIDLQVGDIVELCGHAYCGAADDGDTFDTNVQWFSCDAITGSGKDFITRLFMYPSESTFNNRYTCFSNSVTVGVETALPKCSTFLLIGLGSTFGTVPYYSTIKATWTLTIKRLCNVANQDQVPMALTAGYGYGCDAVSVGIFPYSLYYNPVGATWSYGFVNSVNQFFTDAAKTIPFNGNDLYYYSTIGTNSCALRINSSGYVVSEWCC